MTVLLDVAEGVAVVTLHRPDAREGVEAYLEHRAPRWSGRVSELPRK
jgi:hypothetical protein